MAHASRSSNRQVRHRRDVDYLYDSESFSFLARRKEEVVVSHQTDSDITESSYFAPGNNITNSWRDIEFVRNNLTIDDCVPYNLNFGQANFYHVDTNQSSGATVGNLDLFSGFEKNGEESKVNKSRLETLYRRSSSTRYDFFRA